MPTVLDFTPAIRRGLRVDSYAERNRMQMQLYQNLRCTEFGARPFYAINDPFETPYTESWPSPQILIGKKYILSMGADTLDIVTPTPGGWTVATETTYDYTDPDAEKSIVSGGAWHMMDFWDTMLLFNGVCVVLKTPVSSKWFVITDVTIKTGCDYNDARPFMGGFDASNIYELVDWPTLLSGYDDTAPAEIQTMIGALTGGADANWIWFGTIGGGDLLFFFDETFMTYGSWDEDPGMGYGEGNPYFMDFFQRGQMGFMPMPWSGQVARMKTLGNSVVTYGQIHPTTYQPGGVTACVNYSDGIVGIRDFLDMPKGLGILHQGAVAGDESIHVFLSEACDLWALSPDFKAQKLGYAEYFLPWLDEEEDIIIGSYDPYHKEFYFGNSQEAYLLTQNGLCKAPWVPECVSFAQGGLVGITVATDEPDEVVLRSDVFNAGVPGTMSMLQAVRITGTDEATDGWELYVEYRAGIKDAFTRLGPYTVDVSGVVFLKATGIEFIWELRHPDRTKATLDNVAVEMDLVVKSSLDHRLEKVLT